MSSNIRDIHWVEIAFSSKFKKVDKYGGILLPPFIFIFATIIGLLVHPTHLLLGPIIGVAVACPFGIGYWLYRHLYRPVKFTYSDKGIFYILKNGKQGYIHWDNVHSIRQIPRYPDYNLYYRRKAKWYETSNKGTKIDALLLGVQPGKALQDVWHTILKQKESNVKEDVKE